MTTRKSAVLGQKMDEAIRTLKSGRQGPEAVDSALSMLETALTLRGRPPRKPMLALAGAMAAQIEEAAASATNPDREAALRRRLYALYTATGRRDCALESARRFQELTAKSADFRIQAQGLILLAKACYWADDQRGALAFQRQALDLAELAAARGELCLEDEKYFNRHHTLWAFRFAQNTCRWEEAALTFEKAVQATRSWNDPAMLSESLILFAEARMFQGEWSECERLAHECARAAMYAHKGQQSCYPLWLWGRSLVHAGNIQKAVQEISRAIRVAHKTGDAVGLSESLIALAEAQAAQGDNQTALKTAELAEQTAAGAHLGINLAQVRLWRAWIEMQSDSRLAGRNIEPLHACLAMFENLGVLSGWVTALHALGHALALSGSPETARIYLELAHGKFLRWNMHWHAFRAESSLHLTLG
ncbi:hypothetical protein LLH00_10760 [bacterium]|nr:hypothetical protein [bacterium]